MQNSGCRAAPGTHLKNFNNKAVAICVVGMLASNTTIDDAIIDDLISYLGFEHSIWCAHMGALSSSRVRTVLPGASAVSCAAQGNTAALL
jgi:hypothetical protein